MRTDASKTYAFILYGFVGLAAGGVSAQAPVCGSQPMWVSLPLGITFEEVSYGCIEPIAFPGDPCDPTQGGCPDPYISCWADGQGQIYGLCAGGGTLGGPFNHQSACAYVEGDDDEACNDGDACNGVESCDGDGCVSGDPVSCDDGLECTVDSCDADADGGDPCEHLVLDHLCTCEPPLIDVEAVSWTFSPALAGPECPMIGGPTGASGTASVSGTAKVATCANGCMGTDTLMATGGAQVQLCGSGAAVMLAGAYTVGEQGCPTCSPDSCELGCNTASESCQTEGFSGSVSGEVFRRVGKSIKSDNLKLVDLEATVAARIGLTGGAGFQFSERAGSLSCGNCEQCREINVDVNGGVHASADALFSLKVAGTDEAFKVVGKDLARVEAKVNGTSISKTGECPPPPGSVGGGCSSLTASGKVSAKLPEVELPSFVWFRSLRKFSCSISAEACTEANTCEQCTCGGASCSDTKLSATCGLTTPPVN